jgi:hypothetical protein
MTAAELRARWQHRLDEFRRLGAFVSGEAVALEILADVAELESDAGAELLTPAQAATRAGYHPESICRLIRNGKLTNYGTKHRPRVKLSDIPRKAPAQREPSKATSPVAARTRRDASSPTAIAHDAIAGRIGR